MNSVPWWFQTLSSVLAVVFSVWLGLHFGLPHAAQWIAIYGAVAVVSAALPAHRVLGIVGLLVGVAVMAWGAHLMKGAGKMISVHEVVSLHGGAISASREAAALVIGTAWLLIGAGFRLLRA